MKTLQELREEEQKALEELKALYKAKKEKAKLAEQKIAVRESKAERKALNHVKFLLAGALIVDMKKTGDVSRLRALLAEQEKDADKKAIERLIKSIETTATPKTASAEKSSEQKRGSFGKS